MTCQVTIHWFAIVGAFFVGVFAGWIAGYVHASFVNIK
jgi:Ca2+-dependent lipid-binding protein